MPEPLPNSSHSRAILMRSSTVLPLFDSVFGVAFTLLAFSVPDNVMSGMDVGQLGLSVAIYVLSGIAVLLYWFKLRRLLDLARLLLMPQLLLGLLSLLVIVLLPKLVQLVVLHGSGTGDFQNWSTAQIVNTVFLAALILFDGICLLFAASLLVHPHVRTLEQVRIRHALKIQVLGALVLLLLGVLELGVTWFNNEYVLLVPLILIAEEWLTAHRFARL
jgi:uncharacterized membrane protein